MEKLSKNKKISRKALILIIISVILFIVVISVSVMMTYKDEVGYNMIKNIKSDNYNNANESEEKGGTVFVGDSLIEFYDLDKFFPSCNYINRGISGDTTNGLRRRIYENVVSLVPKCIVIEIGTNDLNGDDGVEKIFARYKDILMFLKTALPSARIIVQSLYPVNHDVNVVSKMLVKNRNNENVDRMNILLKSFCEETNIEFADINPLLKDENGSLKKEFTTDGLHLNDEGYYVVTEKLNEVLNYAS